MPVAAARRALVLVAACAMATLPLAMQTAAQGSVRTPEASGELVRSIDAYIATVMRDDRVPGAAVVIVHGDSVVMLRGYGVDGRGRAVTPTTGFILGSMSKSFTALALMQLVEQNRIDLDAPAKRYIAWFRTRDSAASGRITVRQLLQHTSGIPEDAPRARGNALTINAHVRALANVALAHEPGVTHEYASPNYLVLAAIIETVSGQSYAEFVRKSVFTPLRMLHTFTDQDRAMGEGMSRGHRYVFGFPVASTLPYETDRMPTAALISSATDLGNYLIAHLNGGRFGESTVISPALLHAMHTDGARSDGFSYGFGWRIGSIAGVRAVHHGGIVPHFRGKMVMLPEPGWGVAVLTNVSSSLPLPLVPTSHRMADGIAAYLMGAPLVASASRHRLFNYALLAAAVLILGWSLRSIWALRKIDRAVDPSRDPSTLSLSRAILLDAAWIMFALVVLPGLFGLTWPELFRATPDVAWWLVAVLAVSTVAIAMRLRLIVKRRHAAR